jgi:curved DNA-binding protein CbpA
MKREITLYAALGIDPNDLKGLNDEMVSERVEQAFKEKAFVVHPDRSRVNTNDLMKLVNEAHDVLSDPTKRRNYDAEIAASERSRFDSRPSAPSPGDDFDSNATQQRPKDDESSTPPSKKQKIKRNPWLLILTLGFAYLWYLQNGHNIPVILSSGFFPFVTCIFGICYYSLSATSVNNLAKSFRDAKADAGLTDESPSSEAKGNAESNGSDDNAEGGLSKRPKVAIVLLAVLLVAGLSFYGAIKFGRAKTTSATTNATTTVTLAPVVNPEVDIEPSPDYWVSNPCSSSNATCANPCHEGNPLKYASLNSTTCTSFVQGAVNNARQSLGLSLISRPSNWYDLSPEQQMFVLINIERLTYGYPPYVGLNAELNKQAKLAADGKIQSFTAVPGFRPIPMKPAGLDFTEIYNAFAVDYDFMYLDGKSGGNAFGTNKTCKTGRESSCWYERDMILGSDPNLPRAGVGTECKNCEVGTARVPDKGSAIWTFVIAKPRSKIPSSNFLWASEVPFFGMTLP